MNEDDRRRKQLSRHKSMPLSPSPLIDDVFTHERDPVVLLKELRRRSMRIYDLEEKCDAKDDTIYALEIERSKMRMTFDTIRVELHDLKKKEKEYNIMLAASPPHRKVVRNVLTQTDDSIMPSLRNRAIRELTFYSDAINQSHFSDMNNTSSEMLLPLPDISMEDLVSAQAVDVAEDIPEDNIPEKNIPEATQERKKPKKLKGLFKLMSCVSKQ